MNEYWTFNGTLTYKIAAYSLFRLSITNLFDRDPPFPLTTNGLGIYDYFGRRFAATVQHKF